MKKVSSELAYVLAILILSFAVALTAAADFGVSMIAAPGYVLSLRFSALSLGECEYLIQSALFVLFCILMRRFKPVYLASYLTCILYGAALDAWRKVVPLLNPSVTPPGSFPMGWRLACFAGGVLLTALAVALFFRVYLYPQVYDFFVKGISARYRLNRDRFKIIFDFCCLCAACAETLIFFGKFRGVGIGTVVMTCVNGLLIGAFGKCLDRRFEFTPSFRRFSRYFELS